MANEEHLTILRQGVEVWNKWRQNNNNRPDLSQANLSDADLQRANLREVNLSRTNLLDAVLIGADLQGADLSAAYLARANLTSARLVQANLCQAMLLEADARLANFEHANLSQAELTDANLSQAILSGAILIRTDFTRVSFHMADLSGADLRNAVMYGANLWRANLSGAYLEGADLRNATFVETKIENADLTGSAVYGISVWEVEGKPKAQLNLNIAPHGEPPLLVDEIEVAQFIYLLLKHQKLRNVINAVTEKGVLILGRFGDGGLEILQAIATKLRALKYLPIIFDFDRPKGQNYTETIKTLVGLSRFVVADLSGPSVPQELYATVPHHKIPFIFIIEKSRKPFAMSVDLLEYPWVIRPPIVFENKEELIEFIPTKIIPPAEERYIERQKLLDQLYGRSTEV